MIEVKNLTKIYDENKDNCVKALHDISFTLPDKGMVFILGKSGSGKSTLLNMLGMLDTPTSGEIIIDGNSFKDFNQDKITGYRDNYIGFIFQNYCLLDNVSVYENIKLAYDLSNMYIDNIESKIDSYLEKLEILEYKYHNANQLSGGQSQRVAIARALIKNPKVILADEPTGNLDSKTAISIFNILKEISKDRLVVIISHDVSNAFEYANRIIEIKDGTIFNDITKNVNYVEPSNKQLVLSNNSNIDDNTFNEVSKIINKYDYQLIKKDSKYIKTNADISNNKYEIEPYKYKLSNSWFIAKQFLKSNTVSTFFTVLTLSLIISILCISQIFVRFDTKNAIDNAIAESDVSTFVLSKGYKEYDNIKSDLAVEINDGDINAFIENGYKGNIYKLINQNICFYPDHLRLESLSKNDVSINYEEFFPKSGNGTLICNREYLEKLYCNDKVNLEDLVLAGSINNLKDDEIIITDFMAESFAYYNEGYTNIRNLNTLYNKVVEKSNSWDTIFSRYKVGAVIDTGYKERYEELIEMYFEALENPTAYKNQIKKIVASADYAKFVEERDTTLNIGYTFNQNYEKTLEDSDTIIPFVYFSNSKLIDKSTNETLLICNANKYSYDNNYCSYYYEYFKNSNDGYMINPGEALMQINYYNDIFNKNITCPGNDDPDFEEKTIIIENYRVEEELEENENLTCLTSFEIKIVGVCEGDINQMFILNNEDLHKLKKDVIYTYALYFDNPTLAYELFIKGRELNYTCDTASFTTINTICNIIDIFNNFFAILALTLIIMAFIVISSYSIKVVRLHKKEIGIIEALGASNNTIIIALIIEIVIICLLTFVISSILTILLSNLSNFVVIEGISLYYGSLALKSLKVFTYRPIVLITSFISLLLISMVSLIKPYESIKKIAPSKIIKANE